MSYVWYPVIALLALAAATFAAQLLLKLIVAMTSHE